jgi:hypothetical protein
MKEIKEYIESLGFTPVEDKSAFGFSSGVTYCYETNEEWHGAHHVNIKIDYSIVTIKQSFSGAMSGIEGTSEYTAFRGNIDNLDDFKTIFRILKLQEIISISKNYYPARLERIREIEKNK